MKKRIFIILLMATVASAPSYADVTTESFDARSSPMGSVGIENFQHDRFTGSAVYTIPLEVAHGTNGMQPNPKLRYFSGSGNSIVGNGWSIDLGKITRSTRLKRPAFNDDDIFVLQLNDSASELVKIGGGEYRTKIESHSRITKSGEFWVVEDGSGRRYEFGYSVSGLSYYLTKASDPHGNYIEIDYFSSDFVGYINTITYTMGNGLTQFRTVEFVYENRSDNYPDNSTGRTVRYNKRVDYIDVKVGSDLYKRYDFSYVYSPNSGKSLLRQIDEVGSDSASRLVLAKFGYVNNTTGFSAPQTITNPAPWDITDRYSRIGDVNGDNYPDLFRIDSTGIKYTLGNGAGWGNAVSLASFGFTTFNANVQLGDVNGDGRDDIIKSETVSNWPARYYVAYNNGVGWDYPVLISNTQYWPIGYSLYYPVNHLAYVNDDKYIDIVRGISDSANVRYTDIYVFYGNGAGRNDPILLLDNLPFNFRLTTYTYSEGGNSYQCASRLADINGDGLADIISSRYNATINEFKFYYILADGRGGWEGAINELPAAEVFNLAWDSTKVYDINRDGFPDIMSGRLYGSEVRYRYFLGNGNGFSSEMIMNNPPPWVSGERNILFVDYNGDGLADSLDLTANMFVSCVLDSPQDDLLKEVTNRFGGKISFNYKSPIQTGDTAFPFSIPVLASLTYEPGVSASPADTANYYYEGGEYDAQNRLFRGFRHVRTTDPLGFVSHTYFHQDDSRLGKIERAENAVKRVLNTYRIDSNAPYDTPLIQIGEYTDSKQRRTAYEYDDHGNMIKTIDYGDIDVTSDEECILTDYALNTSSWLIHLPSRMRFFGNTDGSGAPIAETQYSYDNNVNHTDIPTKGDLTKTKKYLDTKTDYIQISSMYDIYGNEISATDANGYTTIVEYDPTYHAFPVTVTNAKGHIERTSYYMPGDSKGLFGQIRSKVDANGNEVVFEYDPFGRKTKGTGPYDGTSFYGSESYEYGVYGPGENYIIIRTTEEYGSSAHHIRVDIMDGFEKTIQMSQESENPDIFNFTTTCYNERGEIRRVSLPYFKEGGMRTSYLAPDDTVKWTLYSYDAIGRTARITRPDGSATNNSYSGWTTTVVDENGHSRTYIRDAYNRLASVKERNYSEEYVTNYGYDVLDDLILITDHLGNRFEFFYDSLKRRTRMIDPDLGTWTYGYDDNGNLITMTNGNGQVINSTYDQVNRMISKNYASLSGIEVIYSYDEPISANGIGRRTSMQDLSGSARWDYDKEGRLVKLRKVIGGDAYTLEWTYDAMDRVKAILLPNGRNVGFTYNNAGLTETIDGFISGVQYNAAHSPTEIAFSNTIYTTFDYYPENQRLRTIATGMLQSLTYEYDSVGNIKKINNAVRSRIKDYMYDDLDRLVSGDESTYDYNAVGNLIRKNGAIHDYSTNKIHALVNDGTHNYSYDNCGNMETGAGRTISYDAENRPIQIDKDGVMTQFIYDGDGERVKKTVNNGIMISTTIYLEDWYEKEVVR